MRGSLKVTSYQDLASHKGCWTSPADDQKRPAYGQILELSEVVIRRKAALPVLQPRSTS